MTKREYPINTWDQVGKGDVYLSRTYTHGRSPSFYGWGVVGVGFKTDPDAPWYDNGCKVFSSLSHGQPRDRGKGALEAAQKWASETYGIKNWKRNAMGDYIDADKDYKPLLKEIEKKAKATHTTAAGASDKLRGEASPAATVRHAQDNTETTVGPRIKNKALGE